jgi:hypothetical protein
VVECSCNGNGTLFRPTVKYVSTGAFYAVSDRASAVPALPPNNEHGVHAA